MLERSHLRERNFKLSHYPISGGVLIRMFHSGRNRASGVSWSMNAPVLPPWIENPFRLISWWEMEQFSAARFFTILRVLEEGRHTSFDQASDDDFKKLATAMETVCDKMKQIGLTASADCAQRIIDFLQGSSAGMDGFRNRSNMLLETVEDEMRRHLFFWVPVERAKFYSKTAEELVGEQCCQRFPSIQLEIEEATKCFAFGQYTAAAFHLMRSTEAGVRALGRAINYVPPNDMWNLVFKHIQAEVALKPSLRPQHWQTHGKFLDRIWGDLKSVSKAWRNDIAHLADVYSEKEASALLVVVPMLLGDLSSEMDENGTLY